jgi:hypothetical protein
MASPLSTREIYWLKQLKAASKSGLYPGLHWDEAPKIFSGLYQRGCISIFDPPNATHKMRAVITFDGEVALREAADGEA